MHGLAQFNVATDAIDTRDYVYRPALTPLAQEFVCAAFDCTIANARQPIGLKIRDQGSGPTCIGEALAALIDIQRLEMNRTEVEAGRLHVMPPVSSQMLYQMARSLEESPPSQSGLLSLRSALKGFYNCGVCLEATWPSHDQRSFDQMSPAAAEQARELCLGAYYRVTNVLNDYHSALREAGAMIVSASIHDGWTRPRDGVIDPDAGGRAIGHAFVVVGYTAQGFLVLNSFGPQWGGYAHHGCRLPGVALWRYEDWAGSVRDAWVLRLGVSLPGAFRYTVGSYGKPARTAPGHAIQPSSDGPRRNAVIGRYLAFADGRFQQHGLYPTTPETVDTTLSILSNRTVHGVGTPYYTDILLVLHGSPEKSSQVLERLERNIPSDKSDGIYRIAVLWSNDLIEGTATALTPLFAEAMRQTGGPGPDCDAMIETLTRPIGRAVWRDLKNQASQLSRRAEREEDGDFGTVLNRIVDLCVETGRGLNLLSEGAGVHLLAGVANMAGRSKKARSRLLSVLNTIQCVAPTIGAGRFKAIFEPFLIEWKTVWPTAEITVMRPDHQFEEKLGVFPYTRSWSHLIQAAFEDDSDPLLSLDTTSCGLRDQGLRVRSLSMPPGGPATLASLFEHPVASTQIHWQIKDKATRRRGNRIRYQRPDDTGLVQDQSLEPKIAATPIGRSLHIGVNRLHERVYGEIEPLKGCQNDAELWSEVAGRYGYQSQILLDDVATRDAVSRAIEAIAQATRPGDIFFLTYSGHGNTATDFDGDEGEGRYDSTWCLHDGEMTDDEFMRHWRQFPAGSRVVMISDSCHSGSIVAAPNPTRAPFFAAGLGLSRRLPPKAERKLVIDRRRGRPAVAKGEGEDMTEASVLASVRLIAACADEELAYETLGPRVHGALTMALTTALNAGFRGTHSDLTLNTVEHLAAVQTPGEMLVGRRNAAFDAQVAFSIATEPASVGKKTSKYTTPFVARLTSRGIVTPDRIGIRYIPPGVFDWTRLDGSSDAELANLIHVNAVHLSGLATAVGRVRSGTVSGTAFLVAPDLVMTNNHVAATFADPRDWTRSGQPTFEFDGEVVGLDTTGPLAVVGPVDAPNPAGRFDAQKLDIALVRLARPLTGRSVPPLSISRQLRAGDAIAAIGFPAFPGSPREEPVARRVFGPDYKEAKWMSPGRITRPPGSPVGTGGPSDPIAWIVQHDASVLGGSSGSMIVDMGSGAVVAIHFGTYLNRRNQPETNYAHVLATAFERRRDLLRTIDEANRAFGQATPLV